MGCFDAQTISRRDRPTRVGHSQIIGVSTAAQSRIMGMSGRCIDDRSDQQRWRISPVVCGALDDAVKPTVSPGHI
jgi:hypothetical protein